jgi:ABC-type Fe3+ transport system permease subunit
MGLTLMTIGIFFMSTLKEDTSFAQLSIYAFLIGMGLGLSMQTIVIALQNSVDFKDMGVATSANTFFRSVGGTIGVAIFGTVYANHLAKQLPINIAAVAKSHPEAMVGVTPDAFEKLRNNTAILKTFSKPLQDGVLHSFVQSFHVVFLSAVPVTLLGLLISFFLRETPLKTGADHAAARDEAAGESLG